ncbi:MAG: hypothetical protein JKP90_06720 [Desulfofustis sp. PB-SRB1]|nr:hypothetical protein [Desulfofustis sp. PB-SRB1]
MARRQPENPDDGNGRHTIHSYDDRTRLTRTDIYEFTGAGAPFKSIDYFYNEADSSPL